MKILIFTASTGGGHKRAAAAIKAKINELSPETEVNIVDGMEAIDKVYNKTITEGYHIMATVIPEMYGKLYELTDEKEPAAKAVIKGNEIRAKKLLETIYKYEPDIIIICHAFITNMVARLKKKGLLKTKAISLITDYDAHRTYVSKDIDAFVLPDAGMAGKLHDEFEVPEEKIFPLGIPTFDCFIYNETREELCRHERLDPTVPTVLLMAGSFGVTDVLEFYAQLAMSSDPLQLIVITGRNIRLFDQFDKTILKLHTEKKTKLLYFVDNVEDYMHIADVIVTKPGGLTVTESIACNLPMAIYSAFPGQERYNAEFLVQRNAAVMIDKTNGAQVILDLLHDREKLSSMKESIKKLAHPNAAEDIFLLAKKMYEEDKA